MFKINDNYLKLPGSYLFSTIGKKVAAYQQANPDKEIIRLGIGDVTQPLAPAVIDALHKSVDEMGHKNHKKKLRDLLRKKNTDLHKIPPYVCLMKNIISRLGGDFNFFLRNFGRSFGRGGKEI